MKVSEFVEAILQDKNVHSEWAGWLMGFSGVFPENQIWYDDNKNKEVNPEILAALINDLMRRMQGTLNKIGNALHAEAVIATAKRLLDACRQKAQELNIVFDARQIDQGKAILDRRLPKF